MALTLGLTGMDQATEAALRTAFTDANQRVGRWMLVNESDADYVIVDMDSMYGPMSWLRLHAAGKQVIGLTTAPRTQADFRLARPLDIQQMTQLLGDIAGTAPVASPMSATPSAAAVMVPPPTPQVAPQAAAAMAAPAAPTAASPMVAPTSVAAPPQQAAPKPAAPQPSAAMPQPSPPAAAPAAVQTTPTAPAAAPPAPAPTPTLAPSPQAAATPAAGGGFADWLRPGALSGRAQFQRGSGPLLFIDFGQRQYYGPATLKPLGEYFSGTIGLREFEQLDDAAWQLAVAKHGSPQPLNRLQWLGGLLAGQGKLLSGLDAAGKFILNKWPQTEREYPKHFRIATAMMKGPQTVAEIAAASGSTAADVADFINANVATGFAEPAGGAGGLGMRSAR